MIAIHEQRICNEMQDARTPLFRAYARSRSDPRRHEQPGTAFAYHGR